MERRGNLRKERNSKVRRDLADCSCLQRWGVEGAYSEIILRRGYIIFSIKLDLILGKHISSEWDSVLSSRKLNACHSSEFGLSSAFLGFHEREFSSLTLTGIYCFNG